MQDFAQQLEARLRQPGVTYAHLQSLAAAAGVVLNGSGDKEQAISQILQSVDVIKANPTMLVLLPPDVSQEAAAAERVRVEAEAAANAAEKTQRIQRLREALDTSTKVNRTLSLSFVALMFYILLIVASTTDLQLFLPESTVRLPILEVELPLLAFYTFMPFIIIVFHFHLLINLKHHQDKYRFLRVEVGDARTDLQLDPFLLNFLETYKRGFRFRAVLLLVVSTSVFYLPLMAILFMQWRFADYHDFCRSTWQFVALGLDLILCVFFLQTIILSRRDDGIWKLKRVFSWGNIPTLGFGLLGAFVWVIVLKLWLMLDDPSAISWIPTRWLPNIDLTNQSHQVGQVSDGYVIHYLEDSLSESNAKSKALLNFGNPLNLEGRDFRFGNISGTNLGRAVLKNCKMQEANLSRSFLLEADIDGTNFDGANLEESNLRGLDFENSSLKRVRLSNADLTGATLAGLSLVGVDFSYAVLTLASMNNCDLRGADMYWTRLEVADLHNSYIDGVDFTFSHLEAADVSGSSFSGANFDKACLQGANLSGCVGSGASFQDASLACVRFDSTVFDSSKLDRVNWNEFPKWDSVLKFISERIESPNLLLTLRIGYAIEGCIDQFTQDKPNLPTGVLQENIDRYRLLKGCGNRCTGFGIIRNWSKYQLFKDEDSRINYFCNTCPDTIRLARLFDPGAHYWNQFPCLK